MWRELTEADLISTLSEKEVEAYRKSADGAADGGDPVSALLSRTARLVRSYLRAGGRTTLSADGEQIPEGFVSPACDYAAYDVLKRMPVAVGEDRRRARDQAVALFEQAAAGRIVPESADADDAAAQPRPNYMRRRRLLD